MNYKNLNQHKDSVQNIPNYNLEMQKSLIDKAFFLDKAEDTSIFVDFGCANGSLLKFSQMLIPEAIYIG